MRGFYLGPDDLYPRRLYWTTLLVLAFDAVLAAFLLVHLLRHAHAEEPYLGMRNVLAHGCATICPLVVLILVAAGMPDGLLVFALTKMFLLIAVIGNYLGVGLIGERPDGRVYGALAMWNLSAMVIAVAYWKVRSRGPSA